MVEKDGIYNLGPFTPWAYRAAGAPPKTALNFPGGLGGANWGGTTFDPRTGYVIVATQDDGALGWMEQSKDGSLSANTLLAMTPTLSAMTSFLKKPQTIR